MYERLDIQISFMDVRQLNLFMANASRQGSRIHRPGDLRVLRVVFRGFSEEARTRGFPSPPLGGFGYIVSATNYSRTGLVVQSVNLFWFF